MSSSDYSFLVPEMAHDVIENQPFFWFTRSLDILCALFIISIGIYHSYSLYIHSIEQENKEIASSSQRTGTGTTTHRISVTGSAMYSKTGQSKSNKSNLKNRKSRDKKIIGRWSKILHGMTFLFILMSFMVIFILMLNIWSVFPLSYSCDKIVYILVMSFHFMKSTFYGILITRLQVAFGTSAYGYSNYQIYSLFIFIFIYLIITCVGTPFLIYGKWLTEPYIWCHVHIFDNKGLFVPIGVLLWIIMDMLISIILLYLFQKPIRTLIKNITKNKKLANLMVKYTILTWISIILSMLSLLLYLWKHITTLIEISLPFTCFMLILMHVKHDDIFKKLCGLCTKCCHKCHKSGHDYDDDDDDNDDDDNNNSNKKQTEKHVIRYNKAKLSIDDGQEMRTRQESNTRSFIPSSNGNKHHLSVGNYKHAQQLHVPQDSDPITINEDGPIIELTSEKDNGYNTPTPTPTNDDDDDDDPENNVIIPLDT